MSCVQFTSLPKNTHLQVLLGIYDILQPNAIRVLLKRVLALKQTQVLRKLKLLEKR